MEINIDDLTTKNLQGDGAFDAIMTSMQTRLDREFKNGRINGPEYAEVYLGSFEASLLNTVQYLLGRQQADKQAELISQQIITEKDKLLTAELARNHTTAQITQVKKQTEKLGHDIDLVDVQIEVGKKDVIKRTSEIALLDQDLKLQVEFLKKAVFETALTEVMVANATKEGLQIVAQTKKISAEIPLIAAQIKKINSEIPLVAAQVTKIKNESLLITGQIKKINAEIPLVAAQVGKMAAEGALLNQKKISEDGQTKNISTGVIGAQRTLLNKQEKGFDRDSEQKAAKIYADVLTTQIVATDGVAVAAAGFGDKSSHQASSKLLAGIGK